MTELNDLKADFYNAMGQEFGDLVSPPVPFFEASPLECCEVICKTLGDDVTPTKLASLGDSDFQALANYFANWFNCEAPLVMQIAEAIARTLGR